MAKKRRGGGAGRLQKARSRAAKKGWRTRRGYQRRAHPSRWIKRALRHHKKGSLHRSLGVPLGKLIPLKLLRRAAKHGRSKLLRQRASLALTMRKFKKRRK